MKNKIPEPLVYFGAGVVIDRVVQSIFGISLSDAVDHVLINIAKQQRLREKERRCIVDVMGDIVGYLDKYGNIIKGDINDY